MAVAFFDSFELSGPASKLIKVKNPGDPLYIRVVNYDHFIITQNKSVGEEEDERFIQLSEDLVPGKEYDWFLEGQMVEGTFTYEAGKVVTFTVSWDEELSCEVVLEDDPRKDGAA